MATIIPFLRSQDEVASFDQGDIDAMSKALDDVCNDLHINGNLAARETIAMRILDLARSGERNPRKLRDRVVGEANGGADKVAL